MEQAYSSSREDVSKLWPRYVDATLGFPNYWYPVLQSRRVRTGKPVSVTVGGEKVVLVRENGKIFALNDRCPHRGVPLSLGRREFPGMLTCRYHGWTYDVQSGELKAALTDGPDSPICGRAAVRVKTYPVEERARMIWIYLGDGAPPPVEEDIPEELLAADADIMPMVDIRKGDWRHAMENAVDPSHGKYLHRDTPFFFFHKFTAYHTDLRMAPSEDGRWLRRQSKFHWGPSDYPGVGKWPQHGWWRMNPPKKGPVEGKKGRGAAISGGAAVPAIFFVGHSDWQDFQIFVPVDAEHHMAWQVSMKQTRGLGRLLWRLRYWTYIRILHHIVLNRWEDGLMVQNMNCPPEQLFRPDAAIVSWRRWCDDAINRRSPRARPAVQQPAVQQQAALAEPVA